MQILIAAALPPAAVARELGQLLPDRAPNLYAWLQRARAQVEVLPVHETGCTPVELWQLRRAGFAPDLGADQPWSAGLGPLRVNHTAADDAPVWLADLVHLALGAQQPLLTDDLALTDAEDQALFDAAHPALADSGFTFARVTPGRWRVTLPEHVTPGFTPMRSLSPAAIASGAVPHWWPQDAASRPWRRLVNAVQMVWHEHPVNLARSGHDQPVVNGLWLYGGARRWPLAESEPEPAQVCDALVPYAAGGDWGGWLDALAELDRTVLASTLSRPAGTLSRKRERGKTLPPSLLNKEKEHQPSPLPFMGEGTPSGEGAPSCLLLTDTHRLVTLTLPRRWLPTWLSNRLPRRTQNWTAWWSSPN